MKNIFMYAVLPICIIGLVYLIVAGVQKPVNFEQEQLRREAGMIARLKDVRTLQTFYKSENGRFTNSFDTLIGFYRNGSIKIVKQIGSMDDSVAVAQNRVYRDTLLVRVCDTLLRRADFHIDSLSFVPGTDVRFEMRDTVREVSGVNVPLFEACVTYDVLLEGMDKQLLINLNDDRVKAGRYPGLKVGSIDQPNNNAGNWE